MNGVAGAAPPEPAVVVTLVVVGDFPAALVDAVERGLRAELGVEVRRAPAVALPRAAYYPPRRRYRAERLLAHLHAVVGDGRILGLTSVDISTTKGPHADWGVFGLGEIGVRSCVLSLHRLRRRARGAAHLERRVVDVAIHEVGHTLGLPHCDEHAARCVMLDAEGSIRTVDASSGRLGPTCRDRVARDRIRSSLP